MNKKLFSILGIVAFLALLFAGCAGPTGPAGPPGPPGEATKCSACHNDTTRILSRQIQAANSIHVTGGAFERNAADCAICHTSEGFTERIAAGTMEIENAVNNPTPPNCRTCHNIHATYTDKDFAFTTTDPVKLELTGDTIDIGKGNLCANCHQPRWAYPVPGDSGEIELTSNRWGPHHGTQSAILAGVGGAGVDFKGSSVHLDAVAEGCPTCHMAAAYGSQAGGHTFKMSYDYHGHEVDNIVACTPCHEDTEDFNRENLQGEVTAMLEELKGLLIAKGIMNEADGLVVPGKYSAALAGAMWNYEMLSEDGSHGIHNPKYAEALLEYSINAIK